MSERYEIGDPVCVMKMVMEDGGPEMKEFPATVCHVNVYQVGVAYSDGVREMFSKNRNPIRREPRHD